MVQGRRNAPVGSLTAHVGHVDDLMVIEAANLPVLVDSDISNVAAFSL